MFAHRTLLREVGLFDERYFAYCEEADLALRAKAQGWETGLVRGATVVNPHMGTPSRTVDYLQLRNTRSEAHTSELQSLMRLSYAVFSLKKQKKEKDLTKLNT